MAKQELEQVVIQAGEIVITKIKTDLRNLARSIPATVWAESYPDSLMPLTSVIYSPLLKKGPYGHDEIEIGLTHDGTVVENLVHYATDDYDADKNAPDELLGEASDERYQLVYPSAMSNLESLRKATTP